jgi:hypothetical protein
MPHRRRSTYLTMGALCGVCAAPVGSMCLESLHFCQRLSQGGTTLQPVAEGLRYRLLCTPLLSQLQGFLAGVTL